MVSVQLIFRTKSEIEAVLEALIKNLWCIFTRLISNEQECAVCLFVWVFHEWCGWIKNYHWWGGDVVKLLQCAGSKANLWIAGATTSLMWFVLRRAPVNRWFNYDSWKSILLCHCYQFNIDYLSLLLQIFGDNQFANVPIMQIVLNTWEALISQSSFSTKTMLGSTMGFTNSDL